MDDKRLAEIRERAKRATIGPWVWRMPFGSRDGPELASPPNGMCIVMDAVRKGFNGATVRFAQRSDSMGGLMKPAAEFFAKLSGPRDTDYPTPANPDMEFISHARTDIPDLLSDIERLTRERDLLARECGAWRKADLYADMLGVMAGDYETMDPEGYAHRELVRQAQRDLDAAGVKVEG